MPRYDATHYDPPAPVAEVELRNPLTNASVSSVPLLIDTGADTTLLPRNAVERIGAEFDDAATSELIGFDGTRSFTQAVELELIFLNKSFRGKYLLIDAEHGVLGRDVLFALTLLLDGPGLSSGWKIPSDISTEKNP